MALARPVARKDILRKGGLSFARSLCKKAARRKVTLRKCPLFEHCEKAARRSQVQSAKRPPAARKDTLRNGPSVGGKMTLEKVRARQNWSSDNFVCLFLSLFE